jgi:hypothetical protein
LIKICADEVLTLIDVDYECGTEVEIYLMHFCAFGILDFKKKCAHA